MNRLEKLDLLGVASLAAVCAALLVGWIVTSQGAAVHQARHQVPQQSVVLTDDGHMSLTVTAGRGEAGPAPAPTARTASVRPSAGPSLEVALPFALRP